MEEKDMKCTEKGCSGKIDPSQSIVLQTGCHSFDTAYACDQCGRLHFSDGGAVSSRPGKKAYLKEGKLVLV